MSHALKFQYMKVKLLDDCIDFDTNIDDDMHEGFRDVFNTVFNSNGKKVTAVNGKKLTFTSVNNSFVDGVSIL